MKVFVALLILSISTVATAHSVTEKGWCEEFNKQCPLVDCKDGKITTICDKKPKKSSCFCVQGEKKTDLTETVSAIVKKIHDKKEPKEDKPSIPNCKPNDIPKFCEDFKTACGDYCAKNKKKSCTWRCTASKSKRGYQAQCRGTKNNFTDYILKSVFKSDTCKSSTNGAVSKSSAKNVCTAVMTQIWSDKEKAFGLDFELKKVTNVNPTTSWRITFKWPSNTYKISEAWNVKVLDSDSADKSVVTVTNVDWNGKIDLNMVRRGGFNISGNPAVIPTIEDVSC